MRYVIKRQTQEQAKNHFPKREREMVLCSLFLQHGSGSTEKDMKVPVRAGFQHVSKLCSLGILRRLFGIEDTVCRNVQAMDQPIDSREFRDTAFVFNGDKVTAADSGPFGQCFLCQAAVHPCVFDCQSKMYMFIFHYLFISQ